MLLGQPATSRIASAASHASRITHPRAKRAPMRPTAIELLRGIRTMLVEDVLPATATPHLRTQVTLAIGMLDTAAAELNDAPAAYAEERRRMIALAAEAAPVLRRLAPDAALLSDLEALASAPSEQPDLR